MTPRRSLLAASLAASLLAGCEEEALRNAVECTEEEPSFDITASSRLQLVHASTGVTDVIVLDSGRSNEEGSVWRPSTVDVLVGIPADDFDSAKGGKLAVYLWDAVSPKGASKPYEVVQTLDKGELEWTDDAIMVGDDAMKYLNAWCDKPGDSSCQGGTVCGATTVCTETCSDVNVCLDKVKVAWWRFDFTKVIPSDKSFTADRYSVGLKWSSGSPLIGASAFDQPCTDNWTDFGDGGGFDNNSGATACSWPMFKVNAQSITKKVSCD